MSYAAYSILKRDRITPRDRQPQGEFQTIFSQRAERTALFLLHGSPKERESVQFASWFCRRKQTFARSEAALMACCVFQACAPERCDRGAGHRRGVLRERFDDAT
ncbi:hypothetical protein PMIN06_001129 [Paraphaeosphaeria minitans]